MPETRTLPIVKVERIKRLLFLPAVYRIHILYDDEYKTTKDDIKSPPLLFGKLLGGIILNILMIKNGAIWFHHIEVKNPGEYAERCYENVSWIYYPHPRNLYDTAHELYEFYDNESRNRPPA